MNEELINSGFDFYANNQTVLINAHMQFCFLTRFSLKINENVYHRERALDLINVFYSTDENLGDELLNGFKKSFEGINDNAFFSTTNSIADLSDDTFKFILNSWINTLPAI
jgi:hypothetical protein